MKRIIAATLLAIVVVVSTACGPKLPAQTPNPVSQTTETEEEGWCERNFNTCMIIISLSAGVTVGVASAGLFVFAEEQ